MPGTTLGNDLAAVAGGGFVVSTTGDIEGEPGPGMDAIGDDGETGGVIEWSAGAGWKLLPGTGINVANGVAVSADGEWVFIGGWRGKCIRKVRRGLADAEAVTVPAAILVDNLTWTSDGHLLAAGAYDTTVESFVQAHFSGDPRMAAPSRVIRIDPASLEIETLVDYGPAEFGAATTGLEVGGEIWVGAARDKGLARFAFPGRDR
jgi:hypothetical protein